MSTQNRNDRIFIPLIGILSIAVPLIVAFLLFAKKPEIGILKDLDFLPALNAGINSTVAILLLVGLYLVRNGKYKLHKSVMLTAFTLSIIFLLSYVTYHYSAESVKYNGTGFWKAFYIIILLSHILLSVAIVPLALLSIYRGLNSQNARHKKLVRWTWPIWFYVSVTGVAVYLMAHVYNPVVV